MSSSNPSQTNDGASGSSKAPAAWNPSSWRKFPIKQQPLYPDKDALEKAVSKVRALPPLVSAKEIWNLRSQLAEVATGKRFLIQGGDCAERFADCTAESLEKKLKILLQMSLVLTYGARTPTLRIGRIAGQFAKPRSKDYETLADGKKVFSFRGDNVNSIEKDKRVPDPSRLVEGYFHCAATMNYIRTLLDTGFAGLHKSTEWDLGSSTNNRALHSSEYQSMVKRILDAMDFLKVCGVADSDGRVKDEKLSKVDFFTSHEGLHLPLEEAMTERYKGGPTFVNTGAHFLWIGDRTRQLDHAHVEYFRGIANPIGIKVGPNMKVEEIVPLIRMLWTDPEANPGKITLITRFGADKVSKLLPPILREVKKSGLPVVWCCDPCHGNTFTSKTGYKTRSFDSILREIEETFKVHRENGSRLNGVHIELTGEHVTECTGGPEGLLETDLPRHYTTLCDPRLNYAQSLEVAFLIAKHVAEQEGHAFGTADSKAVASYKSGDGEPKAKRQRRS